MKSALLILVFIIYNIGLFWMDNFYLLGLMLFLEISAIIFLSRTSLSIGLRFLCKNGSFVVFVILCNLLFSDWRQALLIGLRLSLAIESTYIVSLVISARKFAQGIAMLCAPLRLFRIDTTELELSIMVALTFIPLLTREARQLHNNLKLKGCGWRNLWRQPQIYALGMVKQIFELAETAEQTLRLKGYD